MKIAIRRGHNSKATGARAIIKEEVEGEKVKNAVVKYLKEDGQKVIDVSPGPMESNSDLAFGVNKANKEKVDVFVSIHFNKAYNHYDGAIGSECWTYGPGKSTDIAKRIVNKLGDCGFKNRGVKHSHGLYELKRTVASAIIVETCFVEATKDVALYKKLGPDAIGKKIAEGIVGHSIKSSKPSPSKSKDIYRIKVDGKQIGAYAQVDNLCKVAKDNWGKAKEIEVEKV